MGKARPAVIARALASSVTPPAGRARIRHRLVKTRHFGGHVRSAWHGRARPEQKHTPRHHVPARSRQRRATPLTGRPPACSFRHDVSRECST